MQKLFIILVFTFFYNTQTYACSSFFSNSETKYFAHNFDWSHGQGYVIKNISGQSKYAYGFRGTNQASWTSKYASITFNQVGKEFPYGGMNEKGLVVKQLWLSTSHYQDNQNETISELEWIQYQLDNYASVNEIIDKLNRLTIKPIATVHYFIADKSGNSAVIDFVEGKTIVNTNKGKNQVITNETYLDSEAYFIKNHLKIDPASRTHFDRYCQVKNSLSKIDIENPSQAFDILKSSAENKDNYKTYWTIVYDLSNLKIYFKSYNNQTVKQIDFSEIDFSTNIEASNINQDYFKFEKYSFDTNKLLLKEAIEMMNFRKEFKMDLELGAEHSMNPNENRIDKIYQDNYADLYITFLSRSPKGNIHYALTKGEENFYKRIGFFDGIFPIDKKENKQVIYRFPKGEYALACFQDTDLDGKLDSKIFGIPKNYGFSRNKRGLFGTPPKYKDAKIDIQSDQKLIVKIK